MPVPRAFNPDLWGMYMDAQGNLLCLCRAPQGPLLALWGTWAVRGAVYADLSGTGMVREAFYAGPSPEVGPSVRREKLPPRKPCIPPKFGEGVEPIGSNSSINWEGIEPIGSNSSTNLGGM